MDSTVSMDKTRFMGWSLLQRAADQSAASDVGQQSLAVVTSATT
jgi:hypothetical protein